MGAGGASDTQWVLTAITGVIAWLSFKTKLHPLWLLAAGSLIGLTGFGQFQATLSLLRARRLPVRHDRAKPCQAHQAVAE